MKRVLRILLIVVLVVIMLVVVFISRKEEPVQRVERVQELELSIEYEPPSEKKGIGVTGWDDGCLRHTCEELAALNLAWGFLWKQDGFTNCQELEGFERLVMIYSWHQLDGRDLSMFDGPFELVAFIQRYKLEVR